MSNTVTYTLDPKYQPPHPLADPVDPRQALEDLVESLGDPDPSNEPEIYAAVLIAKESLRAFPSSPASVLTGEKP